MTRVIDSPEIRLAAVERSTVAREPDRVADAHPGATHHNPGDLNGSPAHSSDRDTVPPIQPGREGKSVAPSTPPVQAPTLYRGQTGEWKPDSANSESNASQQHAGPRAGTPEIELAAIPRDQTEYVEGSARLEPAVGDLSHSNGLPRQQRHDFRRGRDLLQDRPAIVIGIFGLYLIGRPAGGRPLLLAGVSRPPIAPVDPKRMIQRYFRNQNWALIDYITSRHRLGAWSLSEMSIVGESLALPSSDRRVSLNYCDYRAVGLRPRRIAVPNRRQRIAVTRDSFATPQFSENEAAIVRKRSERFNRFLRKGLGLPFRPFENLQEPGAWWRSRVDFFICSDDHPDSLRGAGLGDAVPPDQGPLPVAGLSPAPATEVDPVDPRDLVAGETAAA